MKNAEYKRKIFTPQNLEFPVIHLSHEMQFPFSLWLQNLTLKIEAQCIALISQNTKKFSPSLISQHNKNFNPTLISRNNKADTPFLQNSFGFHYLISPISSRVTDSKLSCRCSRRKSINDKECDSQNDSSNTEINSLHRNNYVLA